MLLGIKKEVQANPVCSPEGIAKHLCPYKKEAYTYEVQAFLLTVMGSSSNLAIFQNSSSKKQTLL